jgi:hypothetical protein
LKIKANERAKKSDYRSSSSSSYALPGESHLSHIISHFEVEFSRERPPMRIWRLGGLQDGLAGLDCDRVVGEIGRRRPTFDLPGGIKARVVTRTDYRCSRFFGTPSDGALCVGAHGVHRAGFTVLIAEQNPRRAIGERKRGALAFG